MRDKQSVSKLQVTRWQVVTFQPSNLQPSNAFKGVDTERSAEAELLAGEAGAATESEKPPYPPSWVDWVADRVGQLPMPAWLFYLAVGLALVLLYIVISWANRSINWDNGSYLVGAPFQLRLVMALSPLFIIGMTHYFDEWAATALADFRPAMALEDAEYESLRYQLTTLPRLQTLVANFIGVALGSIYMLLVSRDVIKQFQFYASPLGTVSDLTLVLLDFLTYSILVYHTIHQLRVVSRIYARCTHVDLFQLSPLYAFSALAARIAIGIALVTSAWIYAISLGASDNVVYLLTPIFAIPLLVATFILPLTGIHRILQHEKRRLQSENALHIKATIAELHRRTDASEYGQMDGINKAMDSLVKEQGVLEKISTWPWQPETVRWVGTALLLPIILAVITRLLLR